MTGCTLRVFEEMGEGQEVPKQRIYGIVMLPDGTVNKLPAEQNMIAQCTDGATGEPLPHEDPENITYVA